MPPFELYLHMLRDEKRTLERFTLPRDSASPLLQMRKHLVEWTVELGDKLNQSNLTIHIALTYVDLLLPSEPSLDKKSLQLMALTSLLLASKYDELDDNIPPLKDFLRSCKSRSASFFEYDDVIAYEGCLLRRLNWDLMVITPLHFIHSLAGMGVVFDTDRLAPPLDPAEEEPEGQKSRRESGIDLSELLPVD